MRTEIIPIHFKIFRRVKGKKIKVEGPANNVKNHINLHIVNTNLASKNSKVQNL